jgi:hypothetical protein
VTVLLGAVQFSGLHLRLNSMYPPADIEALANFTAWTPYQYRVLVPALVRWISAFEVSAEWLGTRVEIARLIQVAALVASYYAMRALIGPLVGRRAAALSALGFFYFLPFQYLIPRRWPVWYPSDVPAVLFFALGLLLIRRRAWALYYPVFCLAALNRETICFLTLVQVAVLFGNVPLRRIALHVLAQGVIFVAVKLALIAAFRDNPGHGLYDDVALSWNLKVVGQLDTWLLMASNFGFLWLPLAAGWHTIGDAFARRALLVVPVYFIAAFSGGQFDELRIYGEMIPVILLGIVGLAMSPEEAASRLDQRGGP